MCNIKSPPPTYSITKYTRVSVWKQECKLRRKGCRSRATVKNTRFSDRVLSISSFSIINSFFSTLIAYKTPVCFSSASITLPKLPLPSTARKLKSSSVTLRIEDGGNSREDACSGPEGSCGGTTATCGRDGRGGSGEAWLGDGVGTGTRFTLFGGILAESLNGCDIGCNDEGGLVSATPFESIDGCRIEARFWRIG